MSYISLSNPLRKKCIELPGIPAEGMPDVLFLKKELHREMLLDNSIQNICGNSNTPITDLIWLQHDPDFDELEEMGSKFILPHKEKM